MDHINTDLTTLEDETLVDWAQKGDEPALMLLLNRHKTTVRIKARRYFLIGADYEDLVQEGMIGLYKAIRDYRPDRQASFRAFADLCIKRQIISAIKTATRQKHIPTSYITTNWYTMMRMNARCWDDEAKWAIPKNCTLIRKTRNIWRMNWTICCPP